MTTTPAFPPDARDRALRAATDLAKRIATAAVWSGDRCTWIGAVADGTSTARGRGHPVYAALGADLYGGTSGVALFLARVGSVMGDDAFAVIARGAMRHALSRRAAIPTNAALGFYAGLPGVAYAAACTGRLLDEPGLLADARAVVPEIAAAPRVGQHDVVFGAAGAILALLAIGDAGGPHAVALALELGDELLAAARGSDDRLFWPDANAPSARGLTGLSHGASGIGAALVELAIATSERRFLEAATRAFAYERGWMDDVGTNWLDLREVPRSGRVDRGELSAGRTWCHGAPGVLLARLRAFALTGDECLRGDTDAALATTVVAVEDWLAARTPPTSLCHGIAGNADVLLQAVSALPGADTHAAMVLAAGVAVARGPDLLAEPEADTAGLMLGEAGRGHLLLRIADRSLPTPLLPVPL